MGAIYKVYFNLNIRGNNHVTIDSMELTDMTELRDSHDEFWFSQDHTDFCYVDVDEMMTYIEVRPDKWENRLVDIWKPFYLDVLKKHKIKEYINKL